MILSLNVQDYCSHKCRRVEHDFNCTTWYYLISSMLVCKRCTHAHTRARAHMWTAGQYLLGRVASIISKRPSRTQDRRTRRINGAAKRKQVERCDLCNLTLGSRLDSYSDLRAQLVYSCHSTALPNIIALSSQTRTTSTTEFQERSIKLFSLPLSESTSDLSPTPLITKCYTNLNDRSQIMFMTVVEEMIQITNHNVNS